MWASYLGSGGEKWRGFSGDFGLKCELVMKIEVELAPKQFIYVCVNDKLEKMPTLFVQTVPSAHLNST